MDGTSTAALIPANTFTTDLAYTYVGILGFAHLPVKDRVSYPLIIGCSGYASATGFELKTTLMGHPGAGSVKFSASNYIVGDNVGTATVSIVRSGGDTLPLMMEYTTSNKTAQAGSNYTAVSGALNFGPGVTSQAITIPITSGCASNGPKSVTLLLKKPGSRSACKSTLSIVVE